MGYRTCAWGRLEGPALAARHWVVSIEELRAAGLSERQVIERVASGVLYRRFRGVYAVGRPHLSFEGHCRAATLACGDGSAVSHISAARLWGIRQSTGLIHVSVARGRKGPPGLAVHRPRSLPLADMCERHGISVTTVARTLLDMSPGQSLETVGKWIHEAGVQRALDCREVHAVLERHRHHRGRGVLEAALAAEVAPETRSELEELFLAICGRAGVPRPRVNECFWSGEALEEVDFCWPDRRVIVEVDGGRYHASRWRRRRDAAKDERFRTVGWTVRRFPEVDIAVDPAAVAEQTRRLAGRGLSNLRDTQVR